MHPPSISHPLRGDDGHELLFVLADKAAASSSVARLVRSPPPDASEGSSGGETHFPDAQGTHLFCRSSDRSFAKKVRRVVACACRHGMGALKSAVAAEQQGLTEWMSLKRRVSAGGGTHPGNSRR